MDNAAILSVQIDEAHGSAGDAAGQEVPLTGSARINQGGLCGIGVLTPMMVLGLAMSVRLVRRRR